MDVPYGGAIGTVICKGDVMRRTISKRLLLEYALEGVLTRRGVWRLNSDVCPFNEQVLPYDSECERDQLDADVRNIERRIKLQETNSKDAK